MRTRNLVVPSPKDTSTTQLLHRRLVTHRGRQSGILEEPDEQETCCEIMSSEKLRPRYPINWAELGLKQDATNIHSNIEWEISQGLNLLFSQLQATKGCWIKREKSSPGKPNTNTMWSFSKS